jgi:hypothetical protein
MQPCKPSCGPCACGSHQLAGFNVAGGRLNFLCLSMSWSMAFKAPNRDSKSSIRLSRSLICL